MMKKLLFFSSLALALCSTQVMAQSSSIPTKTSYGAAFLPQENYAPGRLPYLVSTKKDMNKIQITGVIAEVCQKEGCWIKVRTEMNVHDDILVKVKDHSFAVPKDAAGKRALINGSVTKKTLSVAEQQHYLQDAGASKEEIAAVTSPKEVYEMVATGMLVYNQ
jgi:hypothetical protein